MPHLRVPNKPHNNRFSHPKDTFLNSLVSSLASRCYRIDIPKKSRAYAKTTHTDSGHANWWSNHVANIAPHRRLPTIPSIIATMEVISITNPFIRPLTRPMSRGSNMIISSQDMIISYILRVAKDYHSHRIVSNHPSYEW